MLNEEIKARIEAAVPCVSINLQGEGCNFSVVIIAEVFENLTILARQKMILASVSDLLKTGELHALSIRAYTPTEAFAKGI